MLVETSDDKITITVPASIDQLGLSRVIDYLKYLEITSKSKATQEDIDKLADEVNESWWNANKHRFIK
jgi:predicted trehalose synthase